MPFFKSLLLICTLSLMPAIAAPASAAALSDAEKKEVENVVRSLLLDKEPELVIKAAQTLQDRMEKEAETKAQKNVKKNIDKINKDPDSPVGGNPKGDVTVVEFFDYSCGYCKLAQEHVEKLLETDNNVRFVYKELPILGPDSVSISKAAIASIEQGKYEAFHAALMKTKTKLSDRGVMDVAKEVGLDVEKLEKDMKSDKVEKIQKANLDLAKEIGAQGTPTFIINGKLFGGALPYEKLKEAVDKARETK